jgi:hypothetical protein
MRQERNVARRIAAAGGVVAAVLLAPGGAGLAQTAGGPPAAGAGSAPELRAVGKGAASRHEECVRARAAAFALAPDPVTAGELGLCEEALGRDLEAYDHLMFALEREVPAAPPGVQALWRRYRAAVKRLHGRLAIVMVSVHPANAELLLDGQPLDKNASGRIFAVKPGRHVWTARLPGRPDVTEAHVVRGGDIPDVLLVFPPRPPATAAAASGPVCGACQPPPSEPVEPCLVAGGMLLAVDLCNALAAVLRKMDPTFGVLVGGALSLGFTADVGPGLFLGGEAHWRRKEEWGFHLGLESRFFFPTKGGINTSGEVLDVTLLDFALVPCARYKWVLGCALLDAGVTFASGEALAGPEVEDRGLRPLFMLGMGPRLGVEIPLGDHVGIRAFADLRFSPLPPTGYYTRIVGAPLPEGYRTWEHPPVSGFLGVGVSFR